MLLQNNPDDDSDEGEREIEEDDLADDDDTPKGADASVSYILFRSLDILNTGLAGIPLLYPDEQHR